MDGREEGTQSLWTVGYNAWPAPVRAGRLVGALVGRGVTRVIDVRLNPCGSDAEEGRRYGPKPWTLQPGDAGIVGLLRAAGIAYDWSVELGNPQRRDRRMAVLRGHLDDPEGDWPVHRGLDRLADAVRRPAAVVALLCACADADRCHRAVIARALAERVFEGRLVLREVKGDRRD